MRESKKTVSSRGVAKLHRRKTEIERVIEWMRKAGVMQKDLTALTTVSSRTVSAIINTQEATDFTYYKFMDAAKALGFGSPNPRMEAKRRLRQQGFEL